MVFANGCWFCFIDDTGFHQPISVVFRIMVFQMDEVRKTKTAYASIVEDYFDNWSNVDFMVQALETFASYLKILPDTWINLWLRKDSG